MKYSLSSMAPKLSYPDGSTPSVCIVGAGFSGLCAAIQLKKQLGLDTFTIFDANHDVGGTWLTNTYPGCSCDVPSHLYSLSFELNPNWTHMYAPQPEIWEYLRNVAHKYDLYSKIKFRTQVNSCVWNEATRKWTVSTETEAESSKQPTSKTVQEFDIVVNGCGALRAPHYPEEFLEFKGELVHSGDWKPEVDLKGKVVGVVGSGSSAVQLIPTIANSVKELHVYQRKAPYVFHRVQNEWSERARKLFAYIPILMWLLRLLLFIIFELNVYAFKAGHWLSKFYSNLCHKHLQTSGISDERLKSKLVPKYKYGCKRVCYSESYYGAFKLPHVKLNTYGIKNVGERSITTSDGATTELDTLILCTGYKVQDFFAPMQITGRDGVNVLRQWQKDTPRTYYGITSDLMPNMFMLLGPNTLLGHNTVVFMAECQVNFMVQTVAEMMRRNAKLCVIKEAEQSRWMSGMQAEMKHTIWGTEDCGSWYTNGRNEVTTIWPQSCTSYWRQTKIVDFTHFIFK